MLRTWLTLGLLACTGEVGDTDLEDTDQDTPTWVNLDSLASDLVAEHELPSMALMVVNANGVVALGTAGNRVWGEDDPITAFDAFHLGSNTKAMTATLAGTFVDDGDIAWDSTIQELFPELEVNEAWSEITLMDLLSHHAGVDDQDAFGSVWNDWIDESETPEQFRAELAAAVFADPPDGDPGDCEYSNAGYVLVGAALEQLSGKSWETLMDERIFTPLGMECGFGAPTGGAPWGHTGSPGDWDPQDPSGFADNPPAMGPAGTVHCPLPDWAPFIVQHATHGSLLSEESFAALQQDQGDDYGGGWNVVDTNSGLALQHGGSNTLWNTNLWVFPESGMAYVSATNAYSDPETFEALDAGIVELIGQYPL